MIDSTPWVERSHPDPRAERLALTREQRDAVEALLGCGTTGLRVARRAQALLLMDDGVGLGDIARLVGVNVRTVEEWRSRFKKADNPVAALADAPRSGRPPSLSEADATRVVSEACRPPREVGVPMTQWLAQLLADHLRSKTARSS